METPICDFIRAYAAGNPVRMHMPGHKGKAVLGPEMLDLTEIEGADVLYRSRGIIRRSEENAAALFGTSRTVYSTEGSSLCIRAMLYLALLTAKGKGIPPCLLAGRNAHRTLMTAAALLDLDAYVDNRLQFDTEGKICGRNPGVKGWLFEHCPDIWARYKTAMRYKQLAVKLRQAAGLEDPYPAEAALGGDGGEGVGPDETTWRNENEGVIRRNDDMRPRGGKYAKIGLSTRFNLPLDTRFYTMHFLLLETSQENLRWHLDAKRFWHSTAAEKLEST